MATTIIQTLRPGLLVSLSVRSRGGRHYEKVELEDTTNTETGEERSRWETTRMIADPAEYAKATRVRGKAGNMIRRVCVPSAFGLLCLEDNEPQLRAAIEQARTEIDDFNATATLTYIDLYVITGRIAQDDVEATRAISAELNSMLDAMEQGLVKLEVDNVRKVAGQVSKIGQMLSVDAQRQVDDVVLAVRASCAKITKAGETAAQELDAEVMAALDKARTTFLDFGERVDVAAPVEPGLALDLQAEEGWSFDDTPYSGPDIGDYSAYVAQPVEEYHQGAVDAPQIEFDTNNNEGEQ